MKLKIECIGDNWGFWEVKDESSFYKEIQNEDGTEVADLYFAEGIFEEDAENSYVKSYIESLGQSDWCPPQIYQKPFKIVITHKKETN